MHFHLSPQKRQAAIACVIQKNSHDPITLVNNPPSDMTALHRVKEGEKQAVFVRLFNNTGQFWTFSTYERQNGEQDQKQK